MISVIIPVSVKDFKEGLLDECMYFIERAKKGCPEEVEVLAVVNYPCVGMVKARNEGAVEARGDTLVFIDVDCRMSANFLTEVSQKVENPYFVGGGTKFVKLSHHSLGPVLAGLLFLVPYLLFHQITIGAFWVRKSVFFEICGFREKRYNDLDFAIRLRKYAKANGRKFESIKQSFIIWSTRSLDKHGDWSWITGYKVYNAN
jgi:glycosyltransferase involved in cell wall biosynthesis